MLDPSEASKHQLNVNTDKNKLSKSFRVEEDRLTVVAFEKTNDSPCAITMLKTITEKTSQLLAGGVGTILDREIGSTSVFSGCSKHST